MPRVDPPSEARTKALLSALIGQLEGYSPPEAACAVATLAIMIVRGEMGDDATVAFASMMQAEGDLNRREEACPN